MFNSVRKKLYFGFSIIALLMLLISVVGVLRVSEINDNLTAIKDVNGMKQRYAINFRGSVHDRAIALRDVVLENEKKDIETQLALIEKLMGFYDNSAAPLDKLVYEAEQKDENEVKALNRIKEIEAKTLPLSKRVIDLKLEGRSDEARVLLLGEVRDLYVDWLGAINVLIDQQEAKNKAASERSGEIGGGFVMLMLSVTGAAILFGVLIAMFVSKSLMVSIKKASSLTRSISEGNLQRKETVEGRDEIAQMVGALNETSSSLGNLISKVRSTANAVAASSAQIAKGNTELSDRTILQTQALEESYSNFKKLRSVASETLEDTANSSKLAHEASDVAKEGGQIVKKALVHMDQINESSSKISEITNLIDGIAFQTNILALNAAVEAARAGEQGRGFAVVASEVRSLAQRSAAAAKEIKDLINNNISNITDGNQIMQQTSAIIEQTVEKIQTVSTLVSEIDQKMAEQNRYVSSIEKQMDALDTTTQKNTQLVQKISEASGGLQGQTQDLLKDIEVFKV